MSKLVLTVGISGCGKSTYAKDLMKEDTSFEEVNRDDLRIAIYCNGDRSNYVDYKFSKTREDHITEIAKMRVEHIRSLGKNVIISDTNLNPGVRDFWETFAKSHDMYYEEKVFDTDLHVCLARNLKRDITIPKHVVLRQYDAFRKYIGAPSYSGTEGKPKAVIFDVDGTLANMAGIRKPFEWDKVSLDEPRSQIVELANMYVTYGYRVIVMSGRDSCCYESTYAWLTYYGVRFDKLFMRETGDNRPDPTIKEELFWKHVAPDYDVKLAVDDRTRMVDAWRSMGIECWQVQPGDF